MAKSKQPELKEARLSTDEMKRALPKIERRINELENFDLSFINQRFDPQVQSLEHKYDDTLVEVFGKDTVEYERYRMRDFDTAPLQMGVQQPIQVVRDGLKKGISRGVSNFQ